MFKFKLHGPVSTHEYTASHHTGSHQAVSTTFQSADSYHHYKMSNSFPILHMPQILILRSTACLNNKPTAISNKDEHWFAIYFKPSTKFCSLTWRKLMPPHHSLTWILQNSHLFLAYMIGKMQGRTGIIQIYHPNTTAHYIFRLFGQ